MASPHNPLVILDSVDSTNNYAMAQIRDGCAEHGVAYFSYEQTMGKGRRGKEWQAQKGKNIILSIILKPDTLTIYRQFNLSIATSLACFDFFKNYAGENTKIKWPNDLFWNDRKAGGILIENIINGNRWQWSIIGIGININQIEFDITNSFLPVSLKQITGKDFNVIELAKELYDHVMKRYDQLQNNGYEKMFAEYNQHLFCLHKKVKLKKDNAVFETTVKGVDEQGQLITADTMERQFDFDEVEWIKE